MESVILSACRTPIGSYLGGLSAVPAPQLGAVVLREALSRAGCSPERIHEVILGQVLTAGVGQAPARQAALAAGLATSTGATLVNKVCGSGLKAVMLADQAIRCGDARWVLAGGMESMSQAPYLLPRARQGLRMGHAQLLDSMLHDGLWDPYGDYAMGMTGEWVARECGIDRDSQDAYAARSYQRALDAWDRGDFAAEVVPVTPTGRKAVIVTRDEEPRPTTRETLATLRPAFQEDGTVTAGNASKLSDGAAAVLVAEARAASDAGIQPLARIVATATHSQAPETLMLAPEGAIRTVLARAGWDSADLYEINEPFAAATEALIRRLSLNPERVNPVGGAVALGHPIGASGCRILVTLLHGMQRLGLQRGVASLCLGGGEAVAVAVERIG